MNKWRNGGLLNKWRNGGLFKKLRVLQEKSGKQATSDTQETSGAGKKEGTSGKQD
jgi:hypothetical protein